MPKSAKALLLAVTAFFASLTLTVAAAFTAAFSYGAVALIVPGTGTHNINPPNAVQGYKENAANRFINPSGVPCNTMPSGPGSDCVLEGVDYPASFFPLGFIPNWCPGYACDTWNESVGTGVDNLNAQLMDQLDATQEAGESIILFGYSQGGAVVSREMVDILTDPKISDADKKRISVVTIGNINNPRGLWSRLSFLRTIPLLDITFGPQLPTKGITSTNYSFEYDPVGDAPSYWGNPIAMLNALAAFQYVHGYYLVPNSNGTPDEVMPYGYDNISLAAAINDPKNSRTYEDATFVLIPQKGPLPLFIPAIDLGKSTGTSALVNPIIALLNPVTKLIVDLGYDRETNPGVPQTLSALPFNPATFNPVTFSIKLIAAVVQGIRNAIAVASGDTSSIETSPFKAPLDSLARLDADNHRLVQPLAVDAQVTSVSKQRPVVGGTNAPLDSAPPFAVDTDTTGEITTEHETKPVPQEAVEEKDEPAAENESDVAAQLAELPAMTDEPTKPGHSLPIANDVINEVTTTEAEDEPIAERDQNAEVPGSVVGKLAPDASRQDAPTEPKETAGNDTTKDRNSTAPSSADDANRDKAAA